MTTALNDLINRISFDIGVITSIPMTILTQEGIADSVAWSGLAMIQNTLRPVVSNAVSGVPGSTWIISLWDGMMLKAESQFAAATVV